MALTLVVFTIFPKHISSMAEPVVWGNLPRAQDNPQTIDEAIEAAIIAHEEDPEAHLGEGESLQTHRQNEILDHPQGSALNDKLSKSEVLYRPLFENLASWQQFGFVDNGYGIGFDLFAEYPSDPRSTVFTNLGMPGGYVNEDYALLFQATMYRDGSYNLYSAFLGIGKYYSGGTAQWLDGIAFKVVNDVVTGWLRHSTTEQTVALGTYDFTSPHIMRAQYYPAEDVVRYFIDNALVGSITPSGDFSPSDGQACFDLVLTTTNDITLVFNDVMFSRAIVPE